MDRSYLLGVSWIVTGLNWVSWVSSSVDISEGSTRVTESEESAAASDCRRERSARLQTPSKRRQPTIGGAPEDAPTVMERPPLGLAVLVSRFVGFPLGFTRILLGLTLDFTVFFELNRFPLGVTV